MAPPPSTGVIVSTPQPPAGAPQAPQPAGQPPAQPAPAAEQQLPPTAHQPQAPATPRPQPQPGPPTGSGRTLPVPADPYSGFAGLRAWVSHLDRKLGLRTYVGAAAVILSLATAIVAIVLAVDARDNSASNQDLNELSDQIEAISAAGNAAQTAKDDVNALDARVAALEQQLGGSGAAASDVAKRLSVVESDIEELRGQVADLRGSGSSGSAKSSP